MSELHIPLSCQEHPAITFLRVLVQNSCLNAEDANHLLRQDLPADTDLLDWIVSLQIADTDGGILSHQKLLHCLSEHCGLPKTEIDPLQLDTATLAGVIPAGFAEHHNLLALQINAQCAVIACANPFAIPIWASEIQRMLLRNIQPVLALAGEIRRHRRALYQIYPPQQNTERQITQDMPSDDLPLLQDREDSRSLGDWLVHCAMQRGASDIHIEPRGDFVQARLRIDGTLHDICRLRPAAARTMLSRFKVLAAMDIAEQRSPQDGHLQFSTDGRQIELRLSTLPTVFGEKLAIRILDPHTVFCSFTELGLETNICRQWQQMIHARCGMLLVSGATGSGKTTTVYSSLREIADGSKNICTVEEPVEINEAAFNQTQVRREIGLDFAAGVRALLRQDPDVIMVGEIRDSETAHIALQAALTGHLVFATLHAESSFSAIARLFDLGMPDYLLRETLRGILAQFLVRRLCPACRIATSPDLNAWRRLTHIPPPAQVFVPAGCSQCKQSGYLGRIGLFELLRMDDGIRSVISRDASLRRIQRAARRQGFRSLSETAAAHAAAGNIALEEALQVL